MSRETEIQEIQQKINILKLLVAKLVLRVQAFLHKKNRRAQLYEHARLFIGRDASPLDIVNDDLGCAESVSQILRKLFKFPIITGTWTMNDYLSKDSRFYEPQAGLHPGTIIICATATGNGKIRGHVGIIGKNNIIMSANSKNGLWTANYTLDTWLDRWENYGGFPVHYYAPY